MLKAFLWLGKWNVTGQTMILFFRNGSFKTSLVTYNFPAQPWAPGTSSSLAMTFKCLRLSPRVAVPTICRGRSSARLDPALKCSWTAALTGHCDHCDPNCCETDFNGPELQCEPWDLNRLWGNSMGRLGIGFSDDLTMCPLCTGCSMRVGPLPRK